MHLDPAAVFSELSTRERTRLDDLPLEHGIYALYDHTGTRRYIGITMREKGGFRGRINAKHASGSESRSHKFSHAYNTGRMWREKKDGSSDARLAKRLRTSFIRSYCRATFFIVPVHHWTELSSLEMAVQALAPVDPLGWGGRRGFDPVPEPFDLVETLIDELRFSPEQRAAVERQAARQPPR